MIGDDPVMYRIGAVRIAVGEMRRLLDQVAQQVGGIVVMRPVQGRRHALQTHAGIDRRSWQVIAGGRVHLLVLHEHQIPYLDEAVSVLIGTARRTTRDMIAMIEEDLGAGSAGSGITHRPEIVGGRYADDAVIRQARDLLPQCRGLVIFRIDRDQQAVLRQAILPRDQVPGQFDGLVLEVVAKGEVPEHLEERMMPRGVADIVQIVVLAARPHALLGRDGAAVIPLFLPREDVLELDHSGIGEHQGRIIVRHKR